METVLALFALSLLHRPSRPRWLLLVGTVRPLDLAIELRGAWLDVGMTDALVLDVPMELGLELMAIVGPHLADPEGEPGNDVVDEGDRIGLGVPV